MQTLVERSLWPYSERNGIGADAQAQELFGQPEVELYASEKEAVRAFGECLIEGQINGVDGQPITCSAGRRSLETVYLAGDGGNTQTYYEGYFDTPQGRDDLRAIAGGELDDSATTIDILFGARLGLLDTETRQAVAIRSLKWYKSVMSDRLMEDPVADAEQPDLDSFVIDSEPERLLTKVEDFAAYKDFYGRVWRDLQRQPQSFLRDAKQAYLEVQAARLNNLIAETYPLALHLAWQSRRSGSDELSGRLASAMPTLKSILDPTKSEASLLAFGNDFMRRIDLVRNGADWDESGTSIGPISRAILELRRTMDSQGPQDPPTPSLPEEVLALFGKTVWDAGQTSNLVAAVLKEDGRLSDVTSTWDEFSTRDGWAADGKWQVIISPRVDSLSVNSRKGAVLVPASFQRTLSQASPAGVLPVEAHENKHVDQVEYQSLLGRSLPVARIRGRRAVTGLEVGGIAEERAMLAMFGVSRPVASGYSHALEAKIRGGNQTEVARASYAAYVAGRVLSGASDRHARNLAVDRSLRLYRLAGHNSQPLDYMDQEVLGRASEQLSAEHQELFRLALGTLSLADAAKLRRVGLLDLQDPGFGSSTERVWRVFARDFLPNILHEAGFDAS